MARLRWETVRGYCSQCLLEMGWGQGDRPRRHLAYDKSLCKHLFYPTASTRFLDQRQTRIYLQSIFTLLSHPHLPLENARARNEGRCSFGHIVSDVTTDRNSQIMKFGVNIGTTLPHSWLPDSTLLPLPVPLPLPSPSPHPPPSSATEGKKL